MTAFREMPPPRFSSFVLVLPVHNEEARIERVVSYYRQFAPMVVVDNFSTDRSAEIARSLGVEVVHHRNAGTCQTPEWFRHVASLFVKHHFALLSCSEFIPARLLEAFDDVARADSAGVVSCRRRSYTCGRLIPRLWDETDVERFFDKRELDYDAIVIHGSFTPLRLERVLRVPAGPETIIEHLRDFDATSLMTKATEYAVVEARDRIRKTRPLGIWWLATQWLTEIYRFIRIPPRHWSRLALREIWARMVMHSIIFWIGWEIGSGETIQHSRARSDALWKSLVDSADDQRLRRDVKQSG